MRLQYEGEPGDRERDRERRHPRKTVAPRWLAAGLLGLLLLVFLPLAIHAERRQDDLGWRGDGRQAVAPIALDGRVWIPDGAPVLLPDRHMVRAGAATGGPELFVVSPRVGGGGGYAPNRHYLRLEADRYQPMQLRNLKPDVRSR